MSTNPSRDFHRESLAGKIFPATIINNQDPQKLQRVQVRVDGPLHQGVEDGHLPWAMRLGSTGRGTTNSVSEMGVPVVGSRVMVQFMDDGDDHPLVIGAAHIGQPHGELSDPNYAHCYGWTDEANNIFFVNCAAKTISVVHSSGAFLLISPDGGIHALAAGPTSMQVNGSLGVSVSGAVDLSSGEGIVLRGPNISFAPGGGRPPSAPSPRGG